ncbi:MAG: hypothetical protein LBR97_01650, partial [Dysgonamonadaceae bacterium]|nr:hypothetical protein [Dysgonamonadaceae bacterium]
SEISRRPIPEAKPVSGRWAVSHESGIHVRGTLADVLSFQAFDGKTVGRETMEICYGKHSGRAGQEKTFPLFHCRLWKGLFFKIIYFVPFRRRDICPGACRKRQEERENK